jgi:predicted transcriptional regulator
MTTTHTTLGAVLRRRRRHLDLSLVHVARDACISPPYVCLIEQGKRRPKWPIVLRLGKILALSTKRLHKLWLKMPHD